MGLRLTFSWEHLVDSPLCYLTTPRLASSVCGGQILCAFVNAFLGGLLTSPSASDLLHIDVGVAQCSRPPTVALCSSFFLGHLTMGGRPCPWSWGFSLPWPCGQRIEDLLSSCYWGQKSLHILQSQASCARNALYGLEHLSYYSSID